MNEWLDKLEEMPDAQKYGIVGVLILLMGFSFWYFVYSPKVAEIQQLDNEIRRLESEIQKGEAMKAKERELEAEVARLDRQLKEALEFLPDKKSLARFIKKVENLAVDVGLDVQRFVPRPEIVQGFEGKAPVELNVKGDFHSIGRFFERLANEKRIVNVQSLNMNGINEEPFTVNAAITVHAFYFTGQS